MPVAEWSGTEIDGRASLWALKEPILPGLSQVETGRSAGAFIDGLLSSAERKTGWMLACLAHGSWRMRSTQPAPRSGEGMVALVGWRGRQRTEALPVHRRIQMIQLTVHYLIGFASTFPNKPDRFVWVDALRGKAALGSPQERGVRTLVAFRKSLRGPAALAYDVVNAPEGTLLAEMAGAAGLRWTIEACFLRAKDDLGLDLCEARSWQGRHRPITLIMAAAALLARLSADQRRHAFGKPPTTAQNAKAA